MRPLAVVEVNADGVHLVARPGLRFVVEGIEEGQLMISEPRLGLQIFARDRKELQKSLDRTIARLWRDAVCSELSPGNSFDWRTRAVLMALFKPY